MVHSSSRPEKYQIAGSDVIQRHFIRPVVYFSRCCRMKKKKLTMKQLIPITVLFFSLLSVSSHGQVAFGIKGGVNLTTLDVKDPELSYDSRTGYHAGIFLRTSFGKAALQPELLLFTQRGQVQSSLFGQAQESFTYLSLPVILKFYPVGGLNLQLGPQFGFLLDGEREYNSFLGSGTQDITEYYKNSDVSVSLGAGYDFPFGLGLDVRYNIGVKDINDAVEGQEARSRIFLLSLGWNFLR